MVSVYFISLWWQSKTGADLRKGWKGYTTLPPWDDLQLSNITSQIHKICICIICFVFSAVKIMLLPQAFISLFTFKICLCHPSVAPFVSGAPPAKKKKNPGSTLTRGHIFCWFYSLVFCFSNFIIVFFVMWVIGLFLLQYHP